MPNEKLLIIDKSGSWDQIFSSKDTIVIKDPTKTNGQAAMIESWMADIQAFLTTLLTFGAKTSVINRMIGVIKLVITDVLHLEDQIKCLFPI